MKVNRKITLEACIERLEVLLRYELITQEEFDKAASPLRELKDAVEKEGEQ